MLCYTFTGYSPGHNIERPAKYWLSMKFYSDFLSEKVALDFFI